MSTRYTTDCQQCPDIYPAHSSHTLAAQRLQHTYQARSRYSRATLSRSDTAPQDTERTPTALTRLVAPCTAPLHSRCILSPLCCPDTAHMHIGDSHPTMSVLSGSSNDPHHTQCSPRPRRYRSLADMHPLHSRCSLRPHHCRWSPDTSQLRSQCTLFGPSHSDTAPPHTLRMMLSRH